jgi:hypothetical protein
MSNDNDQFPFYLSERMIMDLLEAIEDMYCPSDDMQRFIDRLKKKKGECVIKRMEEEMKDT